MSEFNTPIPGLKSKKRRHLRIVRPSFARQAFIKEARKTQKFRNESIAWHRNSPDGGQPTIWDEDEMAVGTIVLFGDSRVNDCVRDAWSYSQFDWFGWGQSLVTGGPVFNILANKGVNGNTTTQMLNRLQSDVISYNPSACLIWGGTNDTWTTTDDVDASYGRMKIMMDQLRANRIHVFCVSEVCSSIKPANYNVFNNYYNELLRQYCFNTSGVDFWDFNSYYVDPTNASGNPLAANTRDGLHPTAIGAYLWGANVVAPALAKFPNRGISLVNSVADNIGTNANSRNVLDVGLFQGTGGAVGTGGSGFLADGWTGSRSAGTPTQVFSKQTRSDGVGANQRTVITSNANGDQIGFGCTLNQNRFITGKNYVFELECTVASAVNMVDLGIRAFFTSASAPTSYSVGNFFQSIGLYPYPAAPGKLTLRSPTWTAHAAYTGCGIDIQPKFSGVGGVQLDIGRVSIKRID